MNLDILFTNLYRLYKLLDSHFFNMYNVYKYSIVFLLKNKTTQKGAAYLPAPLRFLIFYSKFLPVKALLLNLPTCT